MKNKRNFMVRGVLCALLSVITTMAMMMLPNFEPMACAEDETTQSESEQVEDLTVHITNILNTTHTAVAGHAVAYTNDFTMTPGQNKLLNSSGVYSMVGGKNKIANGLGYTYQFQNAFVLREDGSDGIITTETASDYVIATKISYSNDGNVVVTLSDGSTTDPKKVSDVYISPIYSANENWRLNYHYVDKIAQGSGSWSNEDAVITYSHTFSDPSGGAPYNHYQFQYWKNTDNGETYEPGDVITYTSAELPSGTTKDVYVYAMWKPSVTVNYYVDGHQVNSKEDFDSVRVYDYDYEIEGKTFQGWYDENDNRLDDSLIYNAPELTGYGDSELIAPVSYNVYAKFTDNGGDDPDNPDDPDDPDDPNYEDEDGEDVTHEDGDSSAHSVNTGDESSFMVWAFAMMVSGMHIVVNHKS